MHHDCLEMLDTKRINADENIRLKTLSIGLVIPDKFFELAEQGKDFYMFGPHSIHKKYGVHLDEIDMDEWYDTLAADGDLFKKKFNAMEMLTKIAITQFESGYPYIVFIDNANRQHALNSIGRIIQSNLCTEIFQLQQASVINDYGTEDQINYDISCVLGSLNLVNVAEMKMFKESIHEGIEMLTSVSDMSSIQNVPSVKKANEELHSVGLGLMNLHGYLAKNGIQYESEEAKDVARTVSLLMNYHSLEKSMLIAKERGETFVGFEKTDYATGKYFDKYLTNDYGPKTEKAKELFNGMFIPGPNDFKRLMEQVKEHGLYNAYRLAIAPNQSSGYIQNATPSVMPVVDLVENRKYGNSKTYYPMPFLSPTTQFFYKSAYDISQYKLLDLIAEMQPHIDQGISTILYIKSDTSTRDLAKLYIYAWMKGLKSLYYTRSKKLSVEECTSCSV